MIEVRKGIRARLIAAGISVNAIVGMIAPAGTAYPYIVIDLISGGDLKRTSTDVRDEIWQVKAVSGNQAQAESLQASIRTALDEKTLTITGWVNIWTTHQKYFAYTEDLGDQIIYHAGGQYRIRTRRSS